jgi:nucleotidyltransferase substrate binding protein (TIGR01987 family)
MYTTIRWQQRFQNFEKAYIVFQRRIKAYNDDSQNEANQMSLIQAFEVVVELSWKTLKDYLANEETEVNSPKQTIRQAFQFKIIDNGEDWMEALTQRNLTAHTYNDETFNKVLNFIDKKFTIILNQLYTDLKKEII